VKAAAHQREARGRVRRAPTARIHSAAGNMFAVFDGRETPVDERTGDLARALCAAPGAHATKLDGLIVVQPGRTRARCTMRIWNADGSVPETCGNGLRCAAKLACEEGLVDGERFVVDDGAGAHDCVVEREGALVVGASISMGRPRVLALGRLLVLDDALVSATLVDVGNPHCVLHVASVDDAPVTTLGPRLERHPAFPRGSNIEFLALRDAHEADLRVWERGCGETQACGSGTVAAAVAAMATGRAELPMRLHLPGGVLQVARRPDGEVLLTGPVVELRRT
jgi:diaminopimelate epimerase